MIGNYRTAKLLSDFRGDLDELDYHGFEFLGSGCNRYAYLGPDGVVYKIGDSWVNMSEVNMIKRIHAGKRIRTEFAAHGVSVPRVTGYQIRNTFSYVVAMEYIKGSMNYNCQALYGANFCTCKFDLCPSELEQMANRLLNYNDIHEENVIVDDSGKLWIIDFG